MIKQRKGKGRAEMARHATRGRREQAGDEEGRGGGRCRALEDLQGMSQ